MAAEESESANDGSSLNASLQTWGSPQTEQPLTASTMMATTSLPTVDGQAGLNKHEIDEREAKRLSRERGYCDNCRCDAGYALPELRVIKHEVTVDHTKALADKSGQGRLYRDSTHGVVEAAREKRDTLPERLEAMHGILAANPDDHFLLWHDLEIERHAIEKAVPGVVNVYGSQDLDEREQAVINFSDGKIKYLAGKPSVAGTGCNFQYHCHKAIFLGIGFKFAEFIQALHRVYRFLQTHPVEIHIIYAESERSVLKVLETKWAQHNEMVKTMSGIIRKYGLSHEAMAQELTRGFGVERIEIKGENYTLVNNDAIPETRSMATDSVHLILTSIPFSTQYEYSPNYADLGHSDNNEHFFQQMEFLIPELLRTLIPGRIAAIHVKDRIVPGGMTGLGFQIVYPFHKQVIESFTTCPDCQLRIAEAKYRFALKYRLSHYDEFLARRLEDSPFGPSEQPAPCSHRFAYLGMKTIVTDVVRENNQTYRLGWSEQCKDGTKMGVGMPEYLILFRKPPTDTSNSYGDFPVVKSKPTVEGENGPEPWSGRNERRPIVQNSGYSRSRWQIDAHGFERSAGDRLLTPDELRGLSHQQIFRLFREYSLEEVYNFEHHVRIGEELERLGKLPVTFMLLQPQSWHPDVWTDITRMLTLNGAQSAKGKESHLCPLQFDLADRVIAQLSMPGEIVLDPFAGLGTVPYRAVKLGRKGIGIELSPAYFLDSAAYCAAAEREAAMPSLFDTALVDEELAADGEAAAAR